MKRLWSWLQEYGLYRHPWAMVGILFGVIVGDMDLQYQLAVAVGVVVIVAWLDLHLAGWRRRR